MSESDSYQNEKPIVEITAQVDPKSPSQESSNEDANGTRLPRQLHGLLWGIAVTSVLSAIFLFALDNTVVALIQPRIVNSLGEIEKLPWLSVSFALTSVAMNLIWYSTAKFQGKLFGQFNSKKLFLAAVFLFEAGSALCGAAPTMNSFIVGRAICGVGGSGIYMGAINILSVTTTNNERPMYISFTGLTWGAGTVLGPIVGGAFADSSATWRWGFYINLCVGAVAAPIYLLLLPSHDPRPGVKTTQRIRELDSTGMVLETGALVSGVMAISFGGALYAWSSATIIGLFVCSGVLWVLFAVQQALAIFTTKEQRLLPVELTKSWELDILFCQSAAAISCIFITIYFTPLYFQFAHGDKALQAGVHLLPFVFLLVAANVVNGVLMAKVGYYMPWFPGGSILVTIGASLMHTINLGSSNCHLYGYTIVVAVGAGLYAQAPFSVAQAKVSSALVSEATAFIGFGQNVGIALSLPIANAVFLNRATHLISGILPSAPMNVEQGAISGVSGALFDNLEDIQRIEILEAIVEAIKDAYILVLAAGCLSLVLAVFLKSDRLFQEGARSDL